MKFFLKSLLILLLIGGIIYGYASEVLYFSNTFGIQYLFFRALFLGAILGGINGWIFSKKMLDKEDKIPVFMLCLVACLAVFPLLAIKTNHGFAKNTPLSIKAQFIKEEPLITNRFGISKNSKVAVDAFYLYFTKDAKTERIRSKTQSFRTVEVGQDIELPIKQGFWGFDFVDL
jgi:ABC-type xylose transport system permease subunit